MILKGEYKFDEEIGTEQHDLSDAKTIDENGNVSEPFGSQENWWKIPQSVKFDVVGEFDETIAEEAKAKYELANDINKICPDLAESGCGDWDCISCLTNKLYNMGWRKSDDVVSKSEFEQLKHKCDLAVAEREANVKGFTETLKNLKSEVIAEFITFFENAFSELQEFYNEDTYENLVASNDVLNLLDKIEERMKGGE